MNLVHISLTPVAGAPIRLVSLLRRHTKHRVRLIDLKRSPFFEQDLVYAEARDEALSLIEGADIVHLHNHIEVDTVFPLRLQDLKRKGCRVLRHFHIDPFMVSKITGKPVHENTRGGYSDHSHRAVSGTILPLRPCRAECLVDRTRRLSAV